MSGKRLHSIFCYSAVSMQGSMSGIVMASLTRGSLSFTRIAISSSWNSFPFAHYWQMCRARVLLPEQGAPSIYTKFRLSLISEKMFIKSTGVFWSKISSIFPVIDSLKNSSSILPLCIFSFWIMASLKIVFVETGGHCVTDVESGSL